jgi:Lrp/AsnC family transcriptional regulator for asnA, asnC and gidA
MTDLDIIDRCLVALLQADGRLTHAEVARRLAIPEPTVRRRMKRLLDDGVMQIVAVPDPHKIGYGIHAIIGVRVQPGKVHDIIDALQAMRRVRYIGITAGTYDIVLEALFRNNDELREFLTVTLGKIEGVQRTETSYVLDIVKRQYKVGLAADVAEEDCSEEDREILARGRATLRELENGSI